MKQEYKILPQNEKDNSGHSMIPVQNPTKKCSCCLTTFVILGFIVILGGVTGLTISLLYPHEFNEAVSGYWSGQIDTGNDNNSTETETIDEPVSVGNVTFVTGTKTTAKPDEIDKTKDKAPALTTTVAPPTADLDNNGTDVGTSTGTGSSEHSKVTESSTEEDDESDEESEEMSSAEDIATTKAPVEVNPVSEEKSVFPEVEKPKKDKKKKEDEAKKTESQPTVDESVSKNNKTSNSDDYVEEIVEDAEKYIEKVTGIHRTEIVVPLFMFVCFLMSLLLASCCCYLLMRRRDNRRRRVLGKIITDLQTGDSKSILLDQDIDD